jgi:hypothetical protein
VSSIEGKEESDNLINLSYSVEHNTAKNTPSKRQIPKIVISEASSSSSLMNTRDNSSSDKYLSISKSVVKDETLMLSVSPLTLIDSKIEGSKNTGMKTKKQISFKEDINESYSRTLRSRKFSVPLTPRLHLKSSMVC